MRSYEASACILHADLDAFYASVEQRDRPELAGKPVIVGGGAGGGGGVVLAASYEAKRRGVRTAMNTRQALVLCPDACVVEPRMSAYSQASKDVFKVFEDTTPLVEPMSVDEAFLDVGGLRRIAGTPREIAVRLRERVRAEVGLVITVGVARTKFLAKVASGVAKPDGLLVVEPGEEEAFLYPLEVSRLWGVGPVTAANLAERGVVRVGDVAALGEQALVAMLGAAAGRHLFALAHNVDARRVTVGRRRVSIGSQRALGRAPRTHDELVTIVGGLIDGVGRRLRNGHRVARTVTLRVRFADFARITRSFTLAEPTDVTALLTTVADRLLVGVRPDIADRGVSLIGVTLSNLSPADAVQLSFAWDGRDHAALDTAIDAVRNRFGREALGAVSRLADAPYQEVALLEDRPPPRSHQEPASRTCTTQTAPIPTMCASP